MSLEALPDLGPTPVRHPIMVQRWTDVTFLHWRYEADVVQRLLPRGVDVDTYDGSAWVALVPFSMERLGLPHLPPVPYLGWFPEVNVRTYVRAGDRRGVWFFSLDVNRLLPTVAARLGYRLPYCWGRAEHRRVGNVLSSRVERRWPRAPRPATTEIAVRTGSPVEPDDPLVRFLTCRWGLISASRSGRLRYAAVDHGPWPVHHGELLHLDDHLVTAAGLPAPTGDPHVLWSPGVDVRIGLPVSLPR